VSEHRPRERDSRIHHTTTDTRERAYERLRRDGIPRDTASQIADQAVREAHDKLDRR
jgi:hypothetical protein